MKKFIAIIIAMSSIQSQAQITPITSLGFGFEVKNSAIPVQLTAGISFRRNELVAGYTVFFHREDATIPKILFVRYGLNIANDDIQIMPLIGAGMLTKTTYENSEATIISTPAQFKILYGLKVQKPMGLGGLFASYEHCKLSYINAGLFIRIN